MFDSYIICDSCTKPYPSYLISYKGGTEIEHDDIVECEECYKDICYKCSKEHERVHEEE